MRPGPDFRPAPGQIPAEPGVYRFRDADGRVIYVGKAKSLRSRLGSYFQDPSGLHVRTRTMVATARAVDWVVVATEVEALQLEYVWIKEFDPRFNVRYRDDKSYPYLAVTLDEEFPRALVLRGEKRKGVRYFGPYSHAWAIRETVDQLLRVFPMRTCSRGVFRRAQASGRPCLLGYIEKCSAPCVGRVSPEQHRVIVDDFCTFIAGNSLPFVRELQAKMTDASAAMDYERAARLRDDLHALQRALERNTVVLPDGMDADVIGMASDELEAAVRVFHVRDGRIRGERGFVVERLDDADESQLIAKLLEQLYGEDSADVPRSVLVPAAVPDADREALTDWLALRRGGPVRVGIPRRGDKRALLETVTRNAEQSLATHKLRRSGDLTTRSQALTELVEALDLPSAPLRIECFDVSNLGADDVVASMVVFEDALPRPAEYRRFAIKGFQGQNDVGAISEVIGRRFRHLGAPDRREGRFAYRPGLVVIDGGAPQVNAAHQELLTLGLTDIAVVGLAKRLEEVWLPDEEDPIILPRNSQGLFLLQRVRDEAHRSALRYQRQKRSRRMTTSALDDIRGLGPARRQALIAQFGSVAKLRRASQAQIAQVSGIGPALAERILTALLAPAAQPAINLATGEIIGDDSDMRHSPSPA